VSAAYAPRVAGRGAEHDRVTDVVDVQVEEERCVMPSLEHRKGPRVSGAG
jgi:hypothetical protein